MNFREGTRRIGTVLGFAGAIIGLFAGVGITAEVRNSRINAEKFDGLVIRPIVIKIADIAARADGLAGDHYDDRQL